MGPTDGNQQIQIHVAHCLLINSVNENVPPQVGHTGGLHHHSAFTRCQGEAVHREYGGFSSGGQRVGEGECGGPAEVGGACNVAMPLCSVLQQ